MCGVCGIWSTESSARNDAAEAARLMFFSLYALQHRGQESAGLAATDGRDLRVVRRMGLVGQVFSEPDLGVLGGRAAMGHTRYSTTGASKIQNAQPFTVRAEGLGELAIGHNGNCINAREIRDALAAQHDVPVWTLGRIGGDLLEIAPVLGLPIAALVDAHRNGLARALGREA